MIKTCSKLKRYGENIGDKKLSVEHTLNKTDTTGEGSFT